jgi:CUG-BP- and ETR3-like factor
LDWFHKKEWKLFVGMLNKSSEHEHVRQIFSQFGTVKEVHLLHDSYTNRSTGCAFVKFTSKEDAENAIKALHETFQDQVCM